MRGILTARRSRLRLVNALPARGTIPNWTDDHTAKSLPAIRTNIVLVTIIVAAMIVAILVVLVVVVVVVVVFVFVFVLVANLDQVREVQRSERCSLRYRHGPGCRGGDATLQSISVTEHRKPREALSLDVDGPAAT